MDPVYSTLGLVAALTITFGAAYLGSRFPVDGWYAGLSKPTWNPPNWLFGPVWGILYLLMAVAAWLVWRESGLAGAAIPLAVFMLQLGLNAAWSWLFFGEHKLGLAFLEIMALWAAILWTLTGFWELNPISGILLVPYILWVSFASVLNHAIWRLND
ncbi:MAG: tryptophan-rich sensory protein [Anaerolineales bacterium]|nr:MAG: tryptophan-rich sensory protein [Anaerolineales bacterium]